MSGIGQPQGEPANALEFAQQFYQRQGVEPTVAQQRAALSMAEVHAHLDRMLASGEAGPYLEQNRANSTDIF